MEQTQTKPLSIKQDISSGRGKTAPSQERRGGYRAGVVQGLSLDAELRCSKNKGWPSKALNLSLNGVLLEFPKEQAPPSLHIDEKVSIKLCCHEDIVWVPGVVRHRHGNRVGICFPEFMHVNAKSTEQVISRILRAVERGWIREKTQ